MTAKDFCIQETKTCHANCVPLVDIIATEFKKLKEVKFSWVEGSKTVKTALPVTSVSIRFMYGGGNVREPLVSDRTIGFGKCSQWGCLEDEKAKQSIYNILAFKVIDKIRIKIRMRCPYIEKITGPCDVAKRGVTFEGNLHFPTELQSGWDFGRETTPKGPVVLIRDILVVPHCSLTVPWPIQGKRSDDKTFQALRVERTAKKDTPLSLLYLSTLFIRLTEEGDD